MTHHPHKLWTPSADSMENSQLTRYMRWLEDHHHLSFDDYHSLWKWSVQNIEDFWASLWEYFEVISHSPYQRVLETQQMPGARWFTGSTLNYAEHIFRKGRPDQPALLFQSERHELTAMSWAELRGRVASFAHFLEAQGVGKGDRVVAFIPNIPEATIAFLATCSLGAIWSSCSPDFGAHSVIDRFQQIEPRVFITVDGYQYGGKPYARDQVVHQIIQALPTLEKVVWIPYLDEQAPLPKGPSAIYWNDTQQHTDEPLTFTPVPFEHPIWILYSSGTTGIPKAITHSQGGTLMEHLKYVHFHNDVQPGERYFWFSTTGWMMWNFVQATLLAGATIVLYDGSPGYPDLNILWEMTEKAGIQHFGTSAPFLVACMKKGLLPGKRFDLSALRSISSTGSPLPPEAFDYVYEQIKEDLWLVSMSGGTDVCTAFVGGCPLRPVYEGEIQARALGCALYAYDEEGHRIRAAVGEMVIERPMPSMPVCFWNDPGNERYKSAYFEMFPGKWRHGDWIEITDRNSLVIYGRSDATLNRQGVRIGTAEIYNVLNHIPAIKDSLIINLELSGGNHYMPLFVQMTAGEKLSEALEKEIKTQLREQYSPRHVPDEIIAAPDIPYTLSGKKLEAPVKKIMMGMPIGKAANPDSMRNPEALDFFLAFAKKRQIG